MEPRLAALEESLARLELALWMLSGEGFILPVFMVALRAWAMKGFEMSLEHAAGVITEVLEKNGYPKPCKGSEPFHVMLARAKRAGIVGDAPAWRQYRSWRNQSVHAYSDDAARKTIARMREFIGSTRRLMTEAESLLVVRVETGAGE